PLVLIATGALLLARSPLLDVRPFRLGLGIGVVGLMTLLGRDNGGWIGMIVGGALARLLGETGAVIVGGAILLAGVLLIAGASRRPSRPPPSTPTTGFPSARFSAASPRRRRRPVAAAPASQTCSSAPSPSSVWTQRSAGRSRGRG